MESIKLAKRHVGPSEPPYIIAEVGSNHNGDMDLAFRLIDAAVQCKADAVKFQSWSDRSLISRAEYGRNTNYSDKKKHFGSLEEMVKRYQLTPAQHRDVLQYCRRKGVTFCSTPFSMGEADMLEEMGVDFFKIASMDINHLSFLQHVARKRRPMILSTGMSTLGEIDRAVTVIRETGNHQVLLLHCIALYPPDVKIVNLRNIPMLGDAFGCPVGYSDHTLGIGCTLAAVALGACVIEKHFTLDKNMEGWDHAVSADPADMASIVREAKSIWLALGSRQRLVGEGEIEKAKSFRRSLVLKRSMKAGEIITIADVDFKRPGTGIRPDELQYVLGRKLNQDLEEDEILLWTHFVS